MKKLWNKIKELWGKFKALLVSIPSKYLIGFIFGLVVTAFITIVTPKFAEWAFVPVLFLCAFCAFREAWYNKPFRGWLWLSVLLGAALIQVFAWLG